MPRHDGRIEPGQSLNTAISARAWNRAQDAADIVLGDRYSQASGPLSGFYLPSVRVRLADRGWFGQARFSFIDQFSLNFSTTGYATPTMPASNSALASFSDGEKALFGFRLPTTVTTKIRAYPFGDSSELRETGLFVCVGNDSNEFAMSGFAITRVRVFHYSHRYARCPIAFPGITSTQTDEAEGCLDSAFWGPAKVVGYWDGGGFSHAFNSLTWPAYENRWALIHW